jgi:hypothetical protein
MKFISVKTSLVMLCLLTGQAAFGGKWKYSAEEDKMTGKTATFAQMQSDNSLSLDFPYNGPNYGYLIVRKHPQYGLDVIVSINKGQILCSSYDGCKVNVRFGDKAPVTFRASASADHDSTSIFLRNPQGFIDHASKAKSIKLQMSIYKSGAPVLEFESPTPLEWGGKKIK